MPRLASAAAVAALVLAASVIAAPATSAVAASPAPPAVPPVDAPADAPTIAPTIAHPDGPLMLRVLARDVAPADRAAAVGELIAMAEAGSGLATYRVATLHRLGDRIGVGVFPRSMERARTWLLACLPRARCPVEALAGLAEIAHARGEATEAMAWTQLYAEALRRGERLAPGAAGYLPALIQRVRAADRSATRERAWRPAVDALLAEHGDGIEALMAAAAEPPPAGGRGWRVSMDRPADGGRIRSGQFPRGARELHLLCAPREGGAVASRVLVDAFPEPTPGLDADAMFAGAALRVEGEPPAGEPVCVLVPVEIGDGQLRMRG